MSTGSKICLTVCTNEANSGEKDSYHQLAWSSLLSELGPSQEHGGQTQMKALPVKVYLKYLTAVTDIVFPKVTASYQSHIP